MLANVPVFVQFLFFTSAIALLVVIITQKTKKEPNGRVRKLLLLKVGLFLSVAITSCAVSPPAELPVDAESELVHDYAAYEPTAYEYAYPEYTYNGNNDLNGDYEYATYVYADYELVETDEAESDESENGEPDYNSDGEQTQPPQDADADAVLYVPRNDNLVEATVRRVIDGDTLELTNGERVRLIGINTPEVGAPGADEATRFVRDLVEGQTVWLEASGNDRDSFNRLRRYVWVQVPADTQSENYRQEKQLNAMLLSSGLAVVFTPSGGQSASQAETEQVTAPEGSRFIGNRNSEIFHHSGCGSLPAARNRVYFDTRDDAVNAGFRACRRCNP